MLSGTAVYGAGIVSNRSRRLRTIAAVLLIAVLGMAVYGTLVLVPTINHAAGAAKKPFVHSGFTVGSNSDAKSHALNLSAREAHVLRFYVIFEAGYWVVWMALVISLMLIAWLDLREVSRTYLEKRRELWAASTSAALQEGGTLRLANLDSPADSERSSSTSDPPKEP